MKIPLLLICCSFLAFNLNAQIPGASSRRAIPTEVEQSESRITEIITRAEDHFRTGKLHLENNKREKARDEFNSAIDTILESGFDVRSSQRLQTYYHNLIERIYSEEVPVDDLAAKNRAAALVAGNNPEKRPSDPPRIGFQQQSFEPSPLDALSKLVLTPQEKKSLTNGPQMSAGCNKPPSIRGVKLGMTATEFRKLYPQSFILRARDEVGRSMMSLNGRRDQRLKGIDTLAAAFIDGKLYYLSVQYDTRIEWKGIDQFIATFSKTAGVPQKWYGSFEEPSRFLDCKGSYIYAQLLYARGPRVHIVDESGASTVGKREAQLKSPANFRP